jgi:hypothetical protein
VRDVERDASIPLETCEVIVAGYTGRDAESVARHVAELASHGVPAPEAIPAFYPVSLDSVMVTPATLVAPQGTTSGEAEPVLVRAASGDLFLGIGSDHTDREVEKTSIAASKAACEKVIGPEVWRWDSVAGRWDDLELRAFVGGERRLYQDAKLASLRRPEEILGLVDAALVEPGAPIALFLGTVPLLDGEFFFGEEFVATLRDPATGRELRCEYRVVSESTSDGATQAPAVEQR